MRDYREENPLLLLAFVGVAITILAFFVGIAFHLGWSVV